VEISNLCCKQIILNQYSLDILSNLPRAGGDQGVRDQHPFCGYSEAGGGQLLWKQGGRVQKTRQDE
jgi:hypothetical protein